MLARARRLEFTIGPGDTLFIPWNTPHEVRNLTPTCAVSANFLDQSNVNAAIGQARAKAARCEPESERARNLHQIADALDEIDWPEARDDDPHACRGDALCLDEAEAGEGEERLVGRFAAHAAVMGMRPVRLAAPS